jgi:hypothetical protein
VEHTEAFGPREKIVRTPPREAKKRYLKEKKKNIVAQMQVNR